MLKKNLKIPKTIVEVLLPLPVEGTFSYIVPEELQDELIIGKRVVVSFGKKKFYSGIITDIKQATENSYNFTMKPIISVIDAKPIVNAVNLNFWKWISDYYISDLGNVMNVALPSLFKVASETFIMINPNFSGDISNFTEDMLAVLESVQNNKKIAVDMLAERLEIKKVYPLISDLLSIGAVDISEEIHNPYKPRYEDFIQISATYRNEEAINELFDKLTKRAYKQVEFLLAYFYYSNKFGNKYAEVPKSLIYKKADVSTPVLKALLQKGVIEVITRRVSRLEDFEADDELINVKLSDEQTKALRSINNYFLEKKTVLLHGVTSSGKTEIYFKLIEKALEEGKQVLFLVPEIALSTQLVARTVKYFGSKVGVYHSRFNHSERVEIWNKVIDNNNDSSKGYSMVIGARSALFVPFENLGLVIVDEEHESSYKQTDQEPRYHARDAAVYLAAQFNANTLLGSATPSVESYYNSKKGKYGLVELKERYGGVDMPEISVVDMRRQIKENKLSTPELSLELLQEIRATLNAEKQVLIFRNRRGFSLRMECEVCGWIPQCVQCDVSMTYHKLYNQMRCHYCGYHTGIPDKCPNCKSNKIAMRGFGTEKLEETISKQFPEAVVKRMDLDTTRRKNSFKEIITDFSLKRIDILVGTQMIIKGLDFNDVALAAIVNADNILYYPDFRANERAFQQIVQVSGRAGRRNERGKVMIQSNTPENVIIQYASNYDYEAMYLKEIVSREQYMYPPFYRITELQLRHRDYKLLNLAAKYLASILRKSFGNKSVLGPEYYTIPRIKNKYIQCIILKSNKQDRYADIRKRFDTALINFRQRGDFKNVDVIIDVDPK